ncbi:MAG: c-type cytochrome biogenesis protein CcmI, partial [Paracoccus sp. (in: a-proteobacteria)]
NMTPEQRREMIGGMVSQLEARLAEQGGSPEEWARLITSLTVLGNADRARAIWDEAQQRFASAPQALATVRAAAQSSGLTE